MKKTTILIIDDHRLLTQTWTLILNNYAGYEVTAECDNAKEAIELVASLRPDIIMLDVNLPGISGIEAVPLLLQSSCSSKILGVSMHSQPAYARKMIREGAMGYICKTSPSNELFKALEMISDGKKYICGEIKEILAKQMMDEGSQRMQTSCQQESWKLSASLKKGFRLSK
jgi:two-component system invasion response regulator UvrY